MKPKTKSDNTSGLEERNLYRSMQEPYRLKVRALGTLSKVKFFG